MPNSLRRIALFGLSGFFLLGGINHFLNPGFYLSMMPPYLPAPRTLVYISGVLEILGGFGVLHPATRRWAGWGLIALLIAVFPANLYMALNTEEFSEFASAGALYGRLPLQIVFIAWVYYAALQKPSESGS